MKRHRPAARGSTALVLSLLLFAVRSAAGQSPGPTGDPPAAADADSARLACGQAWLERLGRTWAGGPPPERLFGLYRGRRWIGHVRCAVRAAPADSAARFEITVEHVMREADAESTRRSRGRLSAALMPIDWECESTILGKTTKEALHAREGRVHWESDGGDGKPFTLDASVLPGLAVEIERLPGFGLPADADLALFRPGELGVSRLTRLSRAPDGLPGPPPLAGLACWEFVPGGLPFRYIILASPEGEFVEMRSLDSALRLLPIAQEAFGKDRDDAPALADPVGALLRVLRAAKRGERAAVAAGWDLPASVRAMFPDFAGQDQATPAAALEYQRTRYLDDWIAVHTQRLSAPEPLFEDHYGPLLGCTIDGAEAVVRLYLPRVFEAVYKLHRISDPGGAGRWLVYDTRYDAR